MAPRALDETFAYLISLMKELARWRLGKSAPALIIIPQKNPFSRQRAAAGNSRGAAALG